MLAVPSGPAYGPGLGKRWDSHCELLWVWSQPDRRNGYGFLQRKAGKPWCCVHIMENSLDKSVSGDPSSQRKCLDHNDCKSLHLLVNDTCFSVVLKG
jgi:hypothetical protein